MLLMPAPANAAMKQQQQASVWMTTADKAQLLAEQAQKLPFIKSSRATESTILIDDTKKVPDHRPASATLSPAAPRN